MRSWRAELGGAFWYAVSNDRIPVTIIAVSEVHAKLLAAGLTQLDLAARQEEELHVPADEPAFEDVLNARAVLQGASDTLKLAGVLPEVLDQLHSVDARLVRATVKMKQHQCGLPDSIKQALNSGDGTYKP